MGKKLVFVFALSIAMACKHAKDKPDDTTRLHDLTKIEIDPDLLTIDVDTVQNEYSEALEEGLWGKFFGDRAEFFIIPEPENKLFDEKVNLIVLSFLDGQLCQSKYHINTDITEKLIRKYGRFYITGYDQFNRKLIETEGAIIGDSVNWKLNEKLTNYELTWMEDVKAITFRVNKEDVKAPYQYRERLTNYENIFKRIELAEK